ncbi:hypothetical protein GCM10017673_43750 [Streptosporangium violaceochromogenes]|nr:hypothetical protein GCM10017673_43750 [Streptosporangium violaceochromogenes]
MADPCNTPERSGEILGFAPKEMIFVNIVEPPRAARERIDDNVPAVRFDEPRQRRRPRGDTAL